jgi:hypothetical protein
VVRLDSLETYLTSLDLTLDSSPAGAETARRGRLCGGRTVAGGEIWHRSGAAILPVVTRWRCAGLWCSLAVAATLVMLLVVVTGDHVPAPQPARPADAVALGDGAPVAGETDQPLDEGAGRPETVAVLPALQPSGAVATAHHRRDAVPDAEPEQHRIGTQNTTRGPPLS